MTIPEKARLFHACQTVYTPHKRADSYLLCQYLQQLVKWDTPVRNVPTQVILFFRFIWKVVAEIQEYAAFPVPIRHKVYDS